MAEISFWNENLKIVELAEDFQKCLGFRQLRMRAHGKLAGKDEQIHKEHDASRGRSTPPVIQRVHRQEAARSNIQ